MALAALGATPSAIPQPVSGGELFKCKIVTRNALTDDGRLAPNNLQKGLASIQTEFLYDDASQVLRWEAGDQAWEYTRLQAGSSANSLVATRVYQGMSQTVVDVLRIKTYIKGWPFILIEGDEVYTGNCRKF